MRKFFDKILRYTNRKTSSLAFWWLPVKEGKWNCPLTRDEISDYYVDFSEKINYKYLFDSNGVPLLDYKGTVGVRYNPCAIAQYGLGLCSMYIKTKERKYIDKIRKQAEWISNNTKIGKNEVGRLEYDFAGEAYNQVLDKGYISAISQGQAISFLVRAMIILGDYKYLDTANKLFASFKYSIYDGGVVNYDEKSRIYLEEYPTKKISCVLDGFIYAMFGVYDYYLITADTDAENIFFDCCNTVEDRLKEFDLGFWSRADVYVEKPKMPASKFYHNVHVQQLKALYKITSREVYIEYARKWEQYQKNKIYSTLASLYKCWFKVFYY
ncbi:D-glucuronyl C5-epimerase family protein [Roseburia inulinivorans]|uniref:D-glucuronyl C5-epimerase C-terminus n=1 Tax=Roseburia inulinivorans TaxID=360807 RepID=A0A173XKA6_9FIRM|nr:D-glucuronyl C5-epimerase family protein [Roseburia inulinivorans]CUN52281.1 D-glucuronyl C5-epimerase C-terminus [Roseburia inulinivorans]